MLNFLRLAILFAGLILLPVEAFGQGEVQITHAKVLAGNVTPGDPQATPPFFRLLEATSSPAISPPVPTSTALSPQRRTSR